MMHHLNPDSSREEGKEIALPAGSELFTEKLREALYSPNYSPGLVLDALSEHPRLGALLESGGAKGHTLRDHTHAVIAQYDRYFASLPHPENFSIESARLTLALHDIGKYIPPDTTHQHKYTMGVIEGIRELLPVDDTTYAIMTSLINGDPIGRFTQAIERNPGKELKGELKAKAQRGEITVEDLRCYAELVRNGELDLQAALEQAEKAALAIIEAADRLNMSVDEYYTLLFRYFQADSSAHSMEGSFEGGRLAPPSLEFMYELKDDACLGGTLFVYEGNKLVFAPLHGRAIALLESLLFDPES